MPLPVRRLLPRHQLVPGCCFCAATTAARATLPGCNELQPGVLLLPASHATSAAATLRRLLWRHHTLRGRNCAIFKREPCCRSSAALREPSSLIPSNRDARRPSGSLRWSRPPRWPAREPPQNFAPPARAPPPRAAPRVPRCVNAPLDAAKGKCTKAEVMQ